MRRERGRERGGGERGGGEAHIFFNRKRVIARVCARGRRKKCGRREGEGQEQEEEAGEGRV